MTDKLYNGFNNGRDRSDGVGGREVNHGTQETMTKEQILEKHFGSEFYRLKEEGFDTHIYSAMSEWESQQLSAERERHLKSQETIMKMLDDSFNSKMKERERAGKLVEAAKGVIASWTERMSGEIEQFVTSEVTDRSYWSPVASQVDSNEINNLKQTLNEYDTATKES